MSGFTGKVSGYKRLMQQIDRIPGDIQREVGHAVLEGAKLVHNDAVKSLYAHLSSGRTYQSGRSKRVSHTASLPGYPPNSDTGRLAKSVKIEFDESTITAVVGTNLKYGKELEFGSSRVSARPWLYPAKERSAEEIRKLLFQALSNAVKRSAA